MLTNLSRPLALTLTLGLASIAMLAPAHATDGRTVAQSCIDRDDCSITIGANGTFTITFDGGGVIWCPSLDGECIVVSPDTGKVGKSPVAAPISKTPVAAAPGNPVTKNPTPIARHPISVGRHPTSPKPVSGHPVPFHPIPIVHKPIGKPSAPVILVHRGSTGGHRR